MNVEDLLSRLEGVRRSGGGWRARCPAHGSRGPTLSIAEGDRGVLLHCFAGCEVADVLAEIGLAWPDVFEGGGNGQPVASSRVRGRELTPAEWEATWARLGRESEARLDAHGQGDEPPLFRRVTRKPFDPARPLVRDDFPSDEAFAAYQAWRHGDERLPPR